MCSGWKCGKRVGRIRRRLFSFHKFGAPACCFYLDIFHITLLLYCIVLPPATFSSRHLLTFAQIAPFCPWFKCSSVFPHLFIFSIWLVFLCHPPPPSHLLPTFCQSAVRYPGIGSCKLQSHGSFSGFAACKLLWGRVRLDPRLIEENYF